jgi:bla regulator protein BlaR1
MSTLEAVFSWVLTTTWQASVLAVLVLAAQWALGARLNPRWRHALWLLVILRLVLPDVPESALSLFRYAPAAPLNLPEMIPAPAISAPVAAIALPMSHEIFLPHPNYTFLILAIVWLSGAFGLLLLTWFVNRRFARHVANAPQITDESLRQIFADAKAELHVRRQICLVESTQITSPAIMGLFTPTLLLPSGARGKFSPRELRFIFLHELAHLKRGDVFVQALIALLQIVHWFNPVLWYAFRRLRADREPATDALVLSRTGEADKEPYGLMLIKLLEHFNQRHALPTLVGILEDKDQFKRRFGLIAKFTRGAYGWSLLGVLLIAALAAACLTKAKASPPPSTDAASAPASSTSDGVDEKYFSKTLKRDRQSIADSRVLTSTLPADAQMLEAIQRGDAATLNEVLKDAVAPHTFDPDRFDSCPVYWAIHFNHPECLKLLLDHFAGDNGPTDRADQSALELARRAHPNLVPILEEGLKRNRATLTALLTANFHSIHNDLPAFSSTSRADVTQFLLNATAKAGYLERSIGIGYLDVPATATFTSPAQTNVSIWDALQTIASANNLRFSVDDTSEGTITFYPPQDEAAMHPRATPSDSSSRPHDSALDKELLDLVRHPSTDKVGAGAADKVAQLLAQGADPNAKSNGTPALFWALNFGKDDAAVLLIQKGADINAISGQLLATEMASIVYYCPNALEALLKKGAPLKPPGVPSRSVLGGVFSAVPAKAGKMNYLRDRVWTDADYQAWAQRQRRVIDLLAAAGENLNGVPGETPPLIHAIVFGHLDGARELLKLGAKLDVHDANGDTPQSAAQQYHPEFLPELEAAAKRAHEAANPPSSAPPALTSSSRASDLNKELLAAKEDADARRVLVDQVKNLPDDQFVATLAGWDAAHRKSPTSTRKSTTRTRISLI